MIEVDAGRYVLRLRCDPVDKPTSAKNTYRVTVQVTRYATFDFTPEHDWPEDQRHKVSAEAIRALAAGRVSPTYGNESGDYVVSCERL